MLALTFNNHTNYYAVDLCFYFDTGANIYCKWQMSFEKSLGVIEV